MPTNVSARLNPALQVMTALKFCNEEPSEGALGLAYDPEIDRWVNEGGRIVAPTVENSFADSGESGLKAKQMAR